ncbi:hypothetical protein ACFVW1_41510 [Streptomyces olivochromogenes]|uniref:hypothetical protein n=1 Tax=Streptomyces olivochromogenes TaxID=1963 RepID=UPI0036D773B1
MARKTFDIATRHPDYRGQAHKRQRSRASYSSQAACRSASFGSQLPAISSIGSFNLTSTFFGAWAISLPLPTNGISAFSALAHALREIMARAPRKKRQGFGGQR